jgi:hypothetical protein
VLVTQQLADGVKISVEIPADYLAGSDFEFIGDFDNIVNNGQNTDITVTGSVNKLTLNGSAKVGGDGKIVTAEVSAEAGKGTSFETAPISTTGDGKGDVQLPSSGSSGTGGGNYGGGGNTTVTDPLAAAKAALTFDLISGGNANAQNITKNLALPASLSAYAGVAISWASSDEEVLEISDASGIVNRPPKEGEDASVTLTATLTYEDSTETVTFALTVLRQGVSSIDVSGTDSRFAPGYPAVNFDNNGNATLTIKLNEGVASVEQPVWAYYVVDSYTAAGYFTLDKESILYGHSVSVVEQNNRHSVWYSDNIGEYEIADGYEHSYLISGTLTNWMDEYEIGILLLANDNIDDPQASATIVKLTAEQINYLDETPPNSIYSLFSEDGAKIYAYFDDKLSTAEINKPSPEDFTLQGTGANGITVTEVAISNNANSFNAILPGCVTLTLSGAIIDKTDIALTYTPGIHILADINSNTVTGVISGSRVNITIPSVKAYVNPTLGGMKLHFEPGLHYWLQYDGFALLNSLISLEYNESPIVLKDGSGMYSIDMTDVYYNFDPLPSDEEYTASQFKFSIADGLKLFNFQTIVINEQAAESIQPQIKTDVVTAEYDAASGRIKLVFPSETQFDGSNASLSQTVACTFTLMVDGQRLLYRGVARSMQQGEQNYQANVVYMPLTNRLKAAIESSDEVTVSYSQGEHIKQVYTHLTDITGAYLPAFGPVEVIVSGG